jgi:His-Xaa-Ser system radical SAM maturase HxsC
MLTLAGRYVELPLVGEFQAPSTVRLSEQPALPQPLRKKRGFIIRSSHQEIPDGFGCYVAVAADAEAPQQAGSSAPAIALPASYAYLAEGDIVRIDPRNKAIRVLYRRNSPHNSFLLTERCNHYCLMCSQPPRDIDDSWIVDEVLQTILLIDPGTQAIGFTGGEPTLLGDDFIRVLHACKNYLPRTAIHILSNGRRFMDAAFACKYAAVDHPDMMVGIPIYSDVSSIHNYVVQADNAFDETIRGILNLKRLHQRVEIRVVLHKQTYRRLPHLAEFIARNLTFVDQVALMGLENTGFTKANMQELWIDPWDYREELQTAVELLDSHRIHTLIYNHQLCVLDKRLWRFACKSISDWKNEYLSECAGCKEQRNCGGFFSSTITKHSDHIKPITCG